MVAFPVLVTLYIHQAYSLGLVQSRGFGSSGIGCSPHQPGATPTVRQTTIKRKHRNMAMPNPLAKNKRGALGQILALHPSCIALCPKVTLCKSSSTHYEDFYKPFSRCRTQHDAGLLYRRHSQIASLLSKVGDAAAEHVVVMWSCPQNRTTSTIYNVDVVKKRRGTTCLYIVFKLCTLQSLHVPYLHVPYSA